MNPACPLGLLIVSLLGTALGGFATLPDGNSLEVCFLPPEEGPCRARLPSYYYDKTTQSCQQFWYGGCHGNANNFILEEDCKQACGWIEKVPPNCLLEVSEKPCKNATKQYYFNLKSMTCEQVKSGNCLGNENSFPDKAACMRLCVSRRTLTKERKKSQRAFSVNRNLRTQNTQF
ncbi:tissue factor pathway inhibitor 2-like [Echinops telfairi]|uniref:Tissue factor pathway inhibitor 2-like n=1 Tax=Echinops telfairi TaxID=9371 RepID=A0AC55CYJ5_ECHTE|nr:tissue factor pathway inhibitor 2-like [Echinops telfairi]